MNTVISISVIVIAVAVLVSATFVILAFIQVRRAAKLAETVLEQLKADINIISRITSNISFFTQKLSSPVVKIGAVISGLASMFMHKHHKE